MQAKYEQLMKEYENAATTYQRTKLGTKKHIAVGKKLDKASEALEQWRADNKPTDNRSLSDRIASLSW